MSRVEILRVWETARRDVAEDRQCWTAEGAGVNYSITGWLSLELFKQLLARRGLGLITGCKSYGHDPFLPHLLPQVSQPFWGNIHTRGCGLGVRRGGGGRFRMDIKKKRKKRRLRPGRDTRTQRGEEEQTRGK